MHGRVRWPFQLCFVCSATGASSNNVQDAVARALSENAAAMAIHGAIGACLFRRVRAAGA